jgi:pullulanase/glycogen debranching enzyme
MRGNYLHSHNALSFITAGRLSPCTYMEKKKMNSNAYTYMGNIRTVKWTTENLESKDWEQQSAFSKLRKRYYKLRHVPVHQPVCPHGTTRLPLEAFA